MKKIFKYIYLFIISSVVMTTISCEDLKFGNNLLQKPPSSDVTIDTVFSSAEYARRVLWYSYQSLHYGLCASDRFELMKYVGNDALTDLCQPANKDNYANNTYYANLYNAGRQNNNGTYVQARYGVQWSAVRNAWLLVQHIDKVPDMDPAEKSRLKAEAKTLIAIHYSQLFRNFGALPIIDHALNSQDVMPARATLQETIDFMVRLCDEAIACDEFPWALPADERERYFGRMTKASAYAIKVRILLFAASPLFNSDQPYWPGEAAEKHMAWFGNYDQKRWEAAAQACKDFFDANNANGYYKLVTKDVAGGIYQGYENDYRHAFRAAYFDRGTTESLISTHRNIFDTGGVPENERAIRWGHLNPTAEYLDMFPYADGTMPDWDAERAAGKNIFENRDPRVYETFVVHGDEWKGEILNFTNPSKALGNDSIDKYPVSPIFEKPDAFKFNGRSIMSGFGTRKWGLERGGDGGYVKHPLKWSYLRLAEIYLSYAEALNECDKTAEAYQWVDAVRARVGMNGLPKGLSKDEFRAEVLRERACEFGWEEVRWYDLVRWKMKKRFTDELHALFTYQAKGSNKFKYEMQTFRGMDVPQRKWWDEGVFKERLYLSAFPADEVRKGYGLVQNPGWE